MGLFDKKYCDICGNKIGLLGNKKLEDGNCCKDCTRKLSPWFSERRSSTIEEIKEQIAYREDNKQAVAAFNSTRVLGGGTKVYLDEDNRKFMVTSAKNLAEANPDVLDFSQVTGCNMNIDEHSTEEKRQVKDREGHISYQSYNPPRYKYSYDVYVRINVNHPYFNEIRFKLNGSSISVNGVDNMVGRDPRFMNREIDDYCRMAEEIEKVLTNVREESRAAVAAANAPKMAVTCPYCGATTMPDANGCCEYCGGAVNA